jgi:tetratricopeptide (TPR) repeat protein
MHALTRTGAVVVVLAVALGGAAPAFGQAMGRVTGTVTDSAGDPIPGVKITVTTPEMSTFHLEKSTNKKGKYTIAVADATVVYDVRLEKEGYLTLVDRVKASVGGFSTRDFTLLKPSEAQVQGATPPGGEGAGGTAGLSRAAMAYNEGADAQAAGELDKAAERFREASQLDPTMAAPYTGLASVALQRGQYPEAAAMAEQALGIDPSDFRALHIRYEAYRQLGDAAKAAEAAAALKEAGGGGAAARRIFNEAAEAYNSGDPATAKAKFEQVLALDPELVPAYLALGGLYLADGQTAAAGSMAEEVLKREPGNVRALQIRYESARLAGDAEGAKSALAALAEADPEWAATSLYEQAVQLFNSDQAAAAKGLLEQVLASNPGHAKAHYTLGLVLLNLGEVESAKAHLSRFLELAPEDPDAATAGAMLESLG